MACRRAAPRRRSRPARPSRSCVASASRWPPTPIALDVYRVLRATNPSPYMYLLRFDGFDVVGSSPEALVKVDRTAGPWCTRSRAPGSAARPREEDAALAAELLADPKERAEHLMLVDLGRNDLGRVCAPGSVEVVDFMSVERYSHVMHIVSTVTGQRAPTGRTRLRRAGRLLPGGHPLRRPEAARHGDHRGARADPARPLRRLRRLSRLRRRPRHGDRHPDRAAARRPRVRPGRRGHRRRLRPGAEDTECRNKAMAVLRAVAAAGTLRTVGSP